MNKRIKVFAAASAILISQSAFSGDLSSGVVKYSNQSFDENEGKIVSTEVKKPDGFWDWIYNTKLTSYDILPKNSEKDWAQLSYEDRQEIFKAYQEGMRKMPSVSEYDEAEGNLIRLIVKAYPGMSKYWGDAKYFRDVRIIQSHSLIDLDRINISSFEMGARHTDNGAFYSVEPDDHASESTALNSHERMKKGLSPIGPDGMPILLCRLNDDPRASYFEVSHREAVRLLNALETGMNLKNACLTDQIFGEYWTSRLSDIN